MGVMEYKKGDWFAMTSGEYSDFRFHGVFVALKDFTFSKVKTAFKKYLRKKYEVDYDPYFCTEEFIEWLKGKGYITDTDVTTWHTGDI